MNQYIRCTLSKLSIQLLSGQLLEQKGHQYKNIFFSSNSFFFLKKQQLSENSADNRALPKSSLLLSFKSSIAITFYTLAAFPKLTLTQFKFKTLLTSKCLFSYQKSLFFLAGTYYHFGITLFWEELPTLRVVLIECKNILLQM